MGSGDMTGRGVFVLHDFFFTFRRAGWWGSIHRFVLLGLGLWGRGKWP